MDTSKSVFTLYGVDESDGSIFRRNLSRSAFEAFFAKLEPTEVVLEACGGSHHWGRMLAAQGHRPRLIPPQYVKPFVKRGKNDAADAQAIWVAAGQPGMAFVPVKTAEHQARAMIVAVRELLVRQRTQAINALRGHAAEFGVIAGKGLDKIEGLMARIADPAASVPSAAQEMLGVLATRVTELDAQIAPLDRKLAVFAKTDEVARRLVKVPSIGPVLAGMLSLTVDPSQFASGRHFAAWLGLTPKDHSTGGKQRLGGISRAGNERLRQTLVVGAMGVIAHAKPGSESASPWLLELLERKPRKLVAVALANKMARVAWAMMARGEEYRPTPAAA